MIHVASLQGAAHEPKTTENAYTSIVPTIAGFGTIRDSQEQVHEKSRLALTERGMVRPSQSKWHNSSDDEEESEILSSVGGTLPPASRHILKSDYVTSVHTSTKTRKVTPTNTDIRDVHIASSTLPCIDEDSDDDDCDQTTKSSFRGIGNSSRDRASRNRNYVSRSFLSRNQPSKLQQQLGSLPNASLQSLISSLTTSSGSSGSSTATQKLKMRFLERLGRYQKVQCMMK